LKARGVSARWSRSATPARVCSTAATTSQALDNLALLDTNARAHHDHEVMGILAAIVVFLLAAASDALETVYVRAVGERRARHAAMASVGMWAVGTLALMACVEIGWWLLAPEAAGLYVGTLMAARA